MKAVVGGFDREVGGPHFTLVEKLKEQSKKTGTGSLHHEGDRPRFLALHWMNMQVFEVPHSDRHEMTAAPR